MHECITTPQSGKMHVIFDGLDGAFLTLILFSLFPHREVAYEIHDSVVYFISS